MTDDQSFQEWWDENSPNAPSDEACKLLVARAWKDATAIEREACAQACEAQRDPEIESCTAYEDLTADTAIRDCVDAIRARG